MAHNYQTICYSNLLKDLPDRHKEVIVRRFGLRGEKETLEAIGRDIGITRERVRQIEKDSLGRLEDKICLPVFQNVSQDFLKYFRKCGSLKREDLALEDLGGQKFKNHVLFFLTIGKSFQRVNETDDLRAFWTIDGNAISYASEALNFFAEQLESRKEPMALPKDVLPSYVEISKNILQGPRGLYGLRNWPEINPRGIKDRAYLVAKREQKPLHFTQIANLIGGGALVQTVHNELIKDQRFVLVGRGLYALREWGYEAGIVKDVIARTISNAGGELDRDSIMRAVLKQRRVKPNTILLNLQNQKYFLRNTGGKYITRQI